MGIRTIEATEISCQRCQKTLIVKHWRDARNHGWAVPADGQMQLCPECVLIHKGMIMATAIPAGSLADRLPGEPTLDTPARVSLREIQPRTDYAGRDTRLGSLPGRKTTRWIDRDRS